jgi:hypothetical protein
VSCRFFGEFDVIDEVCKGKVHNISFNWFSHDRNEEMKLHCFKVCHWEMIRKTPLDPYSQPGRV